ncbi:subtilisin-like protease SBT1.8 [Eucalyptus grandis]|uniref:subtilisin-like protease SBT1.8 n=1 Tax=Eucalyptus grandis TaxID=71139 RepID=UPI00192EF13E|nr:subtilisin-like protease SBT1.8 [Eucalyptus grandis]
MTTTYIHDDTRNPIMKLVDGTPSAPWALRAGHIYPRKALSPGLVYDLVTDDYIAFVCSLNYAIKQYMREVTNVEDAGSVYKVMVEAPSTVVVRVRVRPRRLVFRKVGEKQRYRVTFAASNRMDEAHGGSITSRDRQHHVRSPVGFLWGEP